MYGLDVIKVCKACGARFETRFEQKRYCSAGCRPSVRAKCPVGEKPCRQCGVTFMPDGRRGPVAVFCSRLCRSRYDKPRGVWRAVRDCVWCGESFIPTAPAMRFCSSGCRYDRAARAKAGDPYPVQCAYCSDVFVLDPKKRCQLRRKYCSPSCTRDAGKARRRVARLGNGTEFIDRSVVFERDGWMCGLCDEPVDRSLKWPDPRSVSLDHVVPISRGGTHTYDNVQCSHLDCNVRAWAKDNLAPV